MWLVRMGVRPRHRGLLLSSLLISAVITIVGSSSQRIAQAECPISRTNRYSFDISSDDRQPVHPPTRSTSLFKNSERAVASETFDRVSSFHNKTKFSFVHISKCSGASFIRWARSADNVRSDGQPTFPVFYPGNAQGTEVGNVYDAHRRRDSVRLTILRSPRSHVMSLFKECRFDHWGKRMAKWQAKHGLRSVPNTGTHEEDFKTWVDYFVAANDTNGLGCYNPWNYQSRALTSVTSKPHIVGACVHDYEPSFDAATAEALRMNWVGITDFYHESICLLAYRVDGAAHPYMTSCACDDDGQERVQSTADLHVDHSAKGLHISSQLELDDLTMMKVDRLTVVDRTVFGVALRGFLAEVVALEAKLGRRFMCESSLEKASPTLAYIANVKALYRLIQAGAMVP